MSDGYRTALIWFAQALTVIVIAWLTLIALGITARAHEWYPLECCSDRDCWRAGPGGAEPEPRYSPTGWVLHDGTLIPHHEARPSPDGQFHVCRHGGSLLGSVIRTDGRPCLWVPMGAS